MFKNIILFFKGRTKGQKGPDSGPEFQLYMMSLNILKIQMKISKKTERKIQSRVALELRCSVKLKIQRIKNRATITVVLKGYVHTVCISD